MKRRLWGILFCVMGLLMACGRNSTTASDSNVATSSNLQVKFVDKELGEEREEYEGVWNSKYGKLTIYRATQQYLWFTYESLNYFCDAVFMRAEKQDDGKYYFYFGTKPSCHFYPLLSGNEGTFTLENGEISETIDNEEWSPKHENKYKFIEKIDKKPKMDILSYLDDYHKAYRFYEDNNLMIRYLGMDKDSQRVSYFYYGNDFGGLTYQHPFDYSFGEITIESTKSECDKTWGAPIQIKKSKKGYCCTYQYKDYHISIYFSEAGSIYDMTLFLKSRKSALRTYKQGDFEMRGSQIVKYLNKNEGDKTVAFPENAVSIENDAFEKTPGKVTMCIPKDIDLQWGAFGAIERADITFEEGRTEITRGAFCGMASSYSVASKEAVSIRVVLPKSIRVLKEDSFSNLDSGTEIDVKLNEGLEEIGDSAVRGLYLDFPDSLKKLGNDAICWSVYGGISEKELILPPHLEEMGDNCIEFDEETDGEGDEEPEVPVVKIPASVKKMGENVVSGGKYVREK